MVVKKTSDDLFQDFPFFLGHLALVQDHLILEMDPKMNDILSVEFLNISIAYFNRPFQLVAKRDCFLVCFVHTLKITSKHCLFNRILQTRPLAWNIFDRIAHGLTVTCSESHTARGFILLRRSGIEASTRHAMRRLPGWLDR